jgi:tripartite-type tricarboxylate transporter receptor subunit TctC
MRRASQVLLALLLLAGPKPALAQTYPERPITVIVPYGAGGPLDTLMRIIGERMRVALGQTIVIENVSGASGSVGVGRAARAAPDGYTVSVGNWATHVVNGATFNLAYDLVQDFEPVALLSSNPYVVVARKDLPPKDLKELIAYLKARPEGATQGTAGPGSGQHISGLYFQKATETNLKFVPYRAGSVDIMKDLVGGHIDLTFDQAITALQVVRSGNVKAYAVTASERLAAAPDIPTVDEAGAPGVYISTWNALWVPKGTHKDVVVRLTAAAMEALADPGVAKRLSDLGQAIPPRDKQTAEALGTFHKAEIARWWPIIKSGDIKAEAAR